MIIKRHKIRYSFFDNLYIYHTFETIVLNKITSGQAPAGTTTVVNPLFLNSPLPSESFLVTAQFTGSNMVITGNETDDIIVKVSLSTNDSFEWIDNGDGIYEPEVGDVVIDMGIRGMIPTVQ